MSSCLILPAIGCGTSLEYGEAAAHFEEASVLEQASPYLGKKVVIKGIVTGQDLLDKSNCKVFLNHSICCNLLHLHQMAAGCTTGETVFMSGILKRCEAGDILLEPAMKRDPKADFRPLE